MDADTATTPTGPFSGWTLDGATDAATRPYAVCSRVGSILRNVRLSSAARNGGSCLARRDRPVFTVAVHQEHPSRHLDDCEAAEDFGTLEGAQAAFDAPHLFGLDAGMHGAGYLALYRESEAAVPGQPYGVLVQARRTLTADAIRARDALRARQAADEAAGYIPWTTTEEEA